MTARKKNGRPAANAVMEHIVTGVRKGRYVPGQYLITRDIEIELGVSKAPVREAIHMLAGEGLVELLPNRSARVAILTLEDLVDFTIVWSVLGALTYRLAASQLKDSKHMRALEQASQAIQDAADRQSPYVFLTSIYDFHRTLAEATKNRTILSFMKSSHFPHFHRHLSQILPGQYWSDHIRAWRRIPKVLLSGDGAGAAALFQEHMEKTVQLLRDDRQNAVLYPMED